MNEYNNNDKNKAYQGVKFLSALKDEVSFQPVMKSNKKIIKHLFVISFSILLCSCTNAQTISSPTVSQNTISTTPDNTESLLAQAEKDRLQIIEKTKQEEKEKMEQLLKQSQAQAAKIRSQIPTPTSSASATNTQKSHSPTSVYIVGDSLTVGSEPYFAENLSSNDDNLVGIDAVNGRSTSNGVDALLDSAQAQDAKTWVVCLGTNDDDSADLIREQVNRVLDAAGNRNVVWVNIVRPPGYENMNKELDTLATEHKNLSIVDWAGYITEHPDYIGEDGVHSNDEGYQARAKLIATKVKQL